MKKFSIKIPYFDSGVKKTFDIEYIIEALNGDTALDKAIKKFNLYTENSQGSWIREIVSKDIKITELTKDN